MNLPQWNFDSLRVKFDSSSTAAKVGAGFAALTTTYLAFNTTKYLFWRYSEKKKKFNSYTSNDEALMGKDLSGRVAIVTGCNIGIGFETAKTLVKRGCCVIMACRTESKAITAREKIIDELGKDGVNVTENDLIVMKLDLSDLSNVSQFVKNFNLKKFDLHYLINNAGLVCPDYRISKNGYELQFATNHLGHFFLTRLLWDNLVSTTNKEQQKEKEKGFKSRIINLTSSGHSFFKDYQFGLKMFDSFIKNKTVMSNEYKKYYSSHLNYGMSKTCNILFSREIARKMGNKNVLSYSVHPGGQASTGLARHFSLIDIAHNLLWFVSEPSMYYKEMKSVDQIASCTLYCVAQNENKLKNGGYYANCDLGINVGKLYLSSACGYEITNNSHELGEKIWQLSEILIQDQGFSLDTPKSS